MTIIEALLYGQVQLTDIPSARLDSQLLLAHATGREREWLMAHGEEELSATQQKQYELLVGKRRDHTPLVHLTNHREFYGLDFYINEDVLTPRVETEQMVEWAIKYAPNDSKLIDIGTGCGAIAIAIAKHRPDLEIWASEVTDEAMKVAKKNAATHEIDLKLVKSDLWEAFNRHPELDSGSLRKDSGSMPGMTFQTVVTNLPYLKDNADLMLEVQKEPDIALFGGPDGLDVYRRLLKELPDHLEKDGKLFTECDPWQQEDLIKEAARVNLKPIEQSYFIVGFKSE